MKIWAATKVMSKRSYTFYDTPSICQTTCFLDIGGYLFSIFYDALGACTSFTVVVLNKEIKINVQMIQSKLLIPHQNNFLVGQHQQVCQCTLRKYVLPICIQYVSNYLRTSSIYLYYLFISYFSYYHFTPTS